jgi:hypothetical protein
MKILLPMMVSRSIFRMMICHFNRKAKGVLIG